MIIKKKAETYNTYTVELSWGQLQAFAQALEADHTDPVRDETLAELRYYMDRIPGPGEDEKDENVENGDDSALPMPPGSDMGPEDKGGLSFPPDETDSALPEPDSDMPPEDSMPEEMDSGEAVIPDEGEPEPKKLKSAKPSKAAKPAKAEVEDRLPEPPSE